MLDDLIKEMQEKGLLSIAPLKFSGKAKAVFEMLALMADTRQIERLEPRDFGKN